MLLMEMLLQDVNWAAVVLGTIVNLLFSSADLFCVVFASVMVKRIRQSNKGAKWAKMAGGSFLVMLGGKLAMDR